MTFLSTLLLSCSLFTAFSHSASVNVREVAKVDAGMALENLAVRSNGMILLTGLNSSILYQFDTTSEAAPIPIAQIPQVNSLMGIVEISPDLFAIAAGNYSRDTSAIPQSFSMWAINLEGCGCNETNTQPALSKIADMPDASFLNGLAIIPPSPEAGLTNATILATDTISGQIFHVNPTTGAQESVLKSIVTGKPKLGAVSVGVNGIEFRLQTDTLYLMNTVTGVYSSIDLVIEYPDDRPLPEINPIGEFKIIAQSIRGDDFALEQDGTAIVAANQMNTIFEVALDGMISTLLGGINSTETVGPTSIAFGRTPADRESIYITLNGFPTDPLATVSEGGRLLHITRGN
ncbi:hypothetical protein HYALB_00007287 [Hymenoscyphus albidus]|uniref:Uncharacterized protein n=1 Tax=Hymenoscyphus albidus TaxID=595503 RepID=A0A9N9M1N5_9HELO|nr:hypothetical protein HYALB_00007287 [Hymenoscyphus albidus]